MCAEHSPPESRASLTWLIHFLQSSMRRCMLFVTTTDLPLTLRLTETSRATATMMTAQTTSPCGCVKHSLQKLRSIQPTAILNRPPQSLPSLQTWCTERRPAHCQTDAKQESRFLREQTLRTAQKNTACLPCSIQLQKFHTNMHSTAFRSPKPFLQERSDTTMLNAQKNFPWCSTATLIRAV